jgi:Ca-activated chloride channel family protein
MNAAALDRRDESANFKLASAVAEFGLLLRQSKFKGNAGFDSALRRARDAAKTDRNGYRTELVQLIEKASALAARKTAGK